MFERPQSGERAVLVHMALGSPVDPDEMQEFIDLATSAGAEVMEMVSGSRSQPDPRLFVGRGKAEEIKQIIEAEEAELVIFDHSLSPSQERNLEHYFKCRVLDRSGLILDIFAQRARSFEGKLQVELAQLRHLSTRLVRGWTHLERQKGGIGLRGPGETQLETDRRLLNARISQIRKRLAKVETQRSQGRRARERAEIPTVSLVGYTNAGKSTLFNTLTQSDVYAEDQLFATLDPTMRRLELPDNSAVILADTVGFVSKLPHELVAAFKSTLLETVEADLLLHVVDDASHQRQFFIEEVNAVLAEIGAEKVAQIKVYNKIDLVEDEKAHVQCNDEGIAESVWLSAHSGEGIDLLVKALQNFFKHDHEMLDLALDCSHGKLHAELYQAAQILADEPDEYGGWQMKVKMEKKVYEQMKKNNQEFKQLLQAH
jgi:GTP-binding protein HflX